MHRSSLTDNAPLYELLIAAFSDVLQHNYMLVRREGYPLMSVISAERVNAVTAS